VSALTWILLIALGASVLLTGLIRRYALASSLLDIPNARSSHTLPTPRGGGLAIVIVFLVGLPLISWQGYLSQDVLWAILGAGLWIALVGFLDDHGHIPAKWRLLAHFMGSAWGIYWLGGMPPVLIFGYSCDLGWIGQILGAIYLVWLLNLYNFMDGIDGLASIEAISVCGGGFLLYMLSGHGFSWELALLTVAVMGFLFWNFPPAKIFMGDAGSGFLGMVIGLFTIQSSSLAPQYFWSWLILLGVFIVDATLTLVRRFLQGEKVYEAHRSHAYQVASRHYGAHKPVALAVAIINVFWLVPMALWVGVWGLDGALGLIVAYFPLLFIANYFNAGVKES
jgi:Fuc2NAc and GlcNAc transferase